MAKLTTSDVVVIKRMLTENNVAGSDIATQFNVARETIYSIKHERSWKHVTLEDNNAGN